MSDKELNISKIMNKVQNRFLLAVATAKRARQLKEGAPKLIDKEIADEDFIPIDIALQEFAEGKLNIVIRENNEEDDDLLEEINQYIDIDLEKKEEEPKSKKESKSKSKSKSLAA